ncbi:hypothetical protein Glove_102g33 [Diversispora epigaea]|uniref:Uncharacterized protein n=1 Tax=Diversispora epigaea TaxID=1348612 RepID=A0A397J7B8_9GLOM|nr:hypothetical protein Glove_102g33 [Diversispora epigaea]
MGVKENKKYIERVEDIMNDRMNGYPIQVTEIIMVNQFIRSMNTREIKETRQIYKDHIKKLAEILELTKKKKERRSRVTCVNNRTNILRKVYKIHRCDLDHVPLAAVKKCIGGLYHTTSKPIYSQSDLVVCEKDWEVNETIALVLPVVQNVKSYPLMMEEEGVEVLLKK